MSSPPKTAYVALLRGINVSGRNSLPMKDLAAMCTSAGCTDVRTYIQSGNVIFRAPAKVAERFPATLSKKIKERFSYQIPVILRAAEDLRSAVKSNPFLRAGEDSQTLHVAFLERAPGPDQLAALDPNRSPPDRFEAIGAEIFLCCPKGYGSTKLTNQYFDSKLETVSTVRNWRTVLTLLEMAET
jgi:uncharacterized protein (DUF1697 family)